MRVLHSLSFVDDPTRMLRAVRFEQRFGFQIEERTLQLMEDARPIMRQVSGERLRHELDLMLSEQNPAALFERLAELDLLTAIHPDLAWTPQISARVKAILETPPGSEWDLPDQVGHIPLARMLAYTAWIAQLPLDQAPGPEASARALAIGELLRFPSALLQAIAAVHRLAPEISSLVDARPGTVVERLEETPRVALYVLQQLSPVEAERAMLQHFAAEWRFVQPVTTGDDLRKLGFPPGPAYRYLLAALRHAWLEGEITSYEQEQARLRDLLQHQNIHSNEGKNSI